MPVLYKDMRQHVAIAVGVHAVLNDSEAGGHYSASAG